MRLSSRFLFHNLGMSCLFGAIFLEILVFTDILSQGYFLGIEQNPIVLAIEIISILYAFGYFVYLYIRFLSQIDQYQKEKK